MAACFGRLHGRVAVITGGASGLGRGAAERFVKNGARVVVADLPQSSGKEVVANLGSANAIFVATDVSSENDVKNLMMTTQNTFGRLDVAVNCAGILGGAMTFNGRKPDPVARVHRLDIFQKIIDVNLVGTFNVIRLSAAFMHENEPDGDDGERGVIINTASVAAFDGCRGSAAYSASKAGVAAMTLPLARDLSRLGIRVNTIAPGLFFTPMMEHRMTEAQFLLDKVPFPQRAGHIDEFAHLVQSIVENPMINGEVIRIDAAWRMQP